MYTAGFVAIGLYTMQFSIFNILQVFYRQRGQLLCRKDDRWRYHYINHMYTSWHFWMINIQSCCERIYTIDDFSCGSSPSTISYKCYTLKPLTIQYPQTYRKSLCFLEHMMISHRAPFANIWIHEMNGGLLNVYHKSPLNLHFDSYSTSRMTLFMKVHKTLAK